MKIERTKNAARNILFGTILKIYQILVPFLLRTAMIYFMGVQYLGLNSLFSSILSVLNLAELGVGSAMVYSMYKPIVEDDAKTIGALMKLYQTYYRLIGVVVLVAGLAVMPFLPYLVKTDTVPSDLNLYLLYILSLSATVISYWLFAYKNCLLSAHQRNDVTSKVTIAINTLMYGFQLLSIIFVKDFYLYMIVPIICNITSNLVSAFVVDRMYPAYKAVGTLDKEKVKQINTRVKDLFTSRIGGVVYDSADTIVISSFLGLSVLAVYQNYFYILSAIYGLVSIAFNACTAGIGNSIIVESKEKNYSDFKKFSFIICWIGGFCSTCLLCLYQPFMEIWMGKELMLDFSAVCCFVVYYFARSINQLLNLYKDASGIWHKDRFRPLAAAMTNLILNLIWVRYIGIYGILLSTVVAIVLVGEPWLVHNLFNEIFNRKDMWPYVKDLATYSFVVLISCVVSYYFCQLFQLPPWPTIFVRGMICCIIPNGLYLAIYRKKKELKDTLVLANIMTKGKFKREISFVEWIASK